MLRIYGQFKVISKGDTKIELIRFLIEHKTHPEKISSDFFKKCVTIRQVDYIPFSHSRPLKSNFFCTYSALFVFISPLTLIGRPRCGDDLSRLGPTASLRWLDDII